MVKKNKDEDFDFRMGWYDGAEVSELLGIFLLHQLNDVISKENLGLYRDDGLNTFENISGPEVERNKKYFAKAFKNNGPKTTLHGNVKFVDFLNVHFNLIKDVNRSYKRPNDDSLCII